MTRQMNHLNEDIKRLYSEGKKQKDIAKELGCSQQKVSLVLVNAGMGYGKGTYNWNESHCRCICELVNDYTSVEIGKILGIGPKNVQKKILLYKNKGILPISAGYKKGQVVNNFFLNHGKNEENKKIRDKNYFLYRKIASEKIGRQIESNEDVHHIDGNPSNNHPDNLVVLTREQHRQIHMEQLREIHQKRMEDKK